MGVVFLVEVDEGDWTELRIVEGELLVGPGHPELK